MVRLIDFVLEDASENQLHCTVWDAHVDQLLPYFNSTSIEPVVLLLQLCRPRELSELVGISAENLLNKYGVLISNGAEYDVPSYYSSILIRWKRSPILLQGRLALNLALKFGTLPLHLFLIRSRHS
ncbi:uncharacterized protein LOC116002731 isoform X2 [Ipomoea triloba]|uniref:uncharacterized protein LOC116002731 isoform X2 n=1 Tax=Ipomoea triloba TaxID=35885 RepID=UPI00125DB309|nr:uncharacterized protein LOC116002731 isoform X2 [Ipomoea triloba]